MKDKASSSVEKTRNFLGSNLFSLDGDTSGLSDFAYSILLRAKSLAKACYLRMQWGGFCDEKSLEWSFIALRELLEKEKLSEKEMIQALNHFTYEMTLRIKPKGNKKERKNRLKEISQAESYAIRFHDKRASVQVDLVEFGASYQVTTKKVNCQEVEKFYNHLDEKPWFQSMPPWEKAFLLASVEEKLSFYTEKTPTTGNRPGGSNFGRDIFSVGNQRAIFYYHSTVSKKSEEEAVAVLKDYFENHKDDRIDDFNKRYPDYTHTSEQEIIIPVLMESLLTPAWYESSSKGGDNNTRMLAVKKAAIEALKNSESCRVVKNNRTYVFKIIENNQPLNGRRSHLIKTDRDRLQAGCEIIQESLKTILAYDSQLPENERQEFQKALDFFNEGNRFSLRKIDLNGLSSVKHSLFVDTLKAYTEAWRKGSAWRDSENHALFLASCESILMQESGGVIELNCKSSKDRVGLVKAHVSFLRISFEKNKKVPRYGKQFKEEFARQIFKTCVTSIPGLIASNVSPGCCGIKDEPLKGGFVVASTVRDFFWWKDNYFKNMPEFFRRANSQSYSGIERFGYGLLGFFSLFLPFILGPIMRAIAYDSMVPSFAAKDKEFKSNKSLAKMNKAKAQKSKKSKIAQALSKIAMNKQSDSEKQIPWVRPEETAAKAVLRYMKDSDKPECLTKPCFGSMDGVELKSSLYHFIFELKREKAKKANIKTRIMEHTSIAFGYPQHTLIRDARDMIVGSAEEEERWNAYNYAQLAATYGIAAETIYEVEGLDPQRRFDFQETVKKSVLEFKDRVLKLDTFEKQCAALDSFIKNKLGAILTSASDGKIKSESVVRDLDKAKDWVALYQQTVAVATIDRMESESGSVEIVRVEEPLTALTPELIAEYENRYQKDWYRVQSNKNRKMIEHFMPYILKGHQIPSQLRKFLPGLKNAYKSSIVLKEKSSGFKKLSHSNHCAAIVPVIMPDHPYLDGLAEGDPGGDFKKLTKEERKNRMHEERVRLTKLGMLQQRMVTGCETSTMVALNSVLADDVIALRELGKSKKTELLDKEMAWVTLKAANELVNTKAAKICLNGFNVLEANNDESIKAFRKKVKAFNAQLKGTSAADFIEKISDSLLRLKKRLNTSPAKRFFSGMDRESIGVKIVQEFTFLSELYNRALSKLGIDHPLSKVFQTHELFYACASGENRTGVVEIAAQIKAITTNFPHFTSGELITMYRRLAQSGHLQYITGSQGSIMGTEGIRDKSMGALPHKFETIKDIIATRHAGYKSAGGYLLQAFLKKFKNLSGGKSTVVAEQAESNQKLTQREKIPPKKCSIHEIKDLLVSFREKLNEKDSNYLNRLILQCDACLVNKADPEKMKLHTDALIKKLSKFAFNAVIFAAEKDQLISGSVKELLAHLFELTHNQDLKTVVNFGAQDLREIKKALKDRKKNTISGAAIGAGVVAAVILTGPLVGSLSALKGLAALGGFSLKAKAAADVVGAATGLLAGRSHGRRPKSIFDKKTEGFFTSIESVIEERKNLNSILKSFKDFLGLNGLENVYVNNRIPTESDLETVESSEIAQIGTGREELENHFVVTLNLENSDLPQYQPMHKELRKKEELRVDRSNNISLAFKKNDLRCVRLENEGLYTPAEQLLSFLHQQNKTEIRLTGNLSETFSDRIKKQAKNYGISVIDSRENKPLSTVMISGGDLEDSVVRTGLRC